MQLREDAPPLVRAPSTSPPKGRHSFTLPGIPEVTPGPNAFAQQAARMERHRLEGNAFYQQEIQRCRITPPTVQHPALRTRSNSEASLITRDVRREHSSVLTMSTTADHLGELPPLLSAPSKAALLRESTVTTMSPFINAGKTPPLKLMPSPVVGQDADPTQRGIIEEYCEQEIHEATGSGEERVAVYNTWKPTPKPPSEEWRKPAEGASAGTPKKSPKKARASLPGKYDTDAGSKSPKKSFFDRLRIGKLGGVQSPSMMTLGGDGAPESGGNTVPVKAQAVLGTSPSRPGLVTSISSRTNITKAFTSTADAADTATTKPGLSRSPSKTKKGLFSRKGAELANVDTTARPFTSTATYPEPRTASSVDGKTPHTAVSDPAHFGRRERGTSQTMSDHGHEGPRANKTPQSALPDPSRFNYCSGGRGPSQALSDGGTFHSPPLANPCTVARSQSLKYIDSTAPPTPPAKNTPPHVKAQKEKEKREEVSSSTLHRVPFHQDKISSSPMPAGIVSTSDRLSPTKFGSYGHREVPTLVSKPSIYSLHASVVPEMFEPGTFEEMKARIDGLGLEGFNNPSEPATYQQRSPEIIYSPSVYHDDWGVSPTIGSRTPRVPPRKALDALATVTEASSERERSTEPSHRTGHSSASGMTIPIVYPELASDPSMSNMIAQLSGPFLHTSTEEVSIPDLNAVRDSGASNHGQTSSDVRVSPRHSQAISMSDMPLPDDEPSMNHLSPASYNHPSAVPSPLHYLPATVYSPPPSVKKARAAAQNRDGRSTQAEGRPTATRHGLGIRTGDYSPSSSPLRSHNIFETAPVLEARPSRSARSSPSPIVDARANDDSTNVDPKKPIVTGEVKDKQDQMLELLTKVLAQHEDVTAMRDEMRANNTRVDERLSAMETLQRASSPSPALTSYLNASTASLHHPDTLHQEQYDPANGKLRVATSFAHDFYHQPGSPGSSASSAVAYDGGRMQSPTSLSAPTEFTELTSPLEAHHPQPAAPETIDDLREKNRLLTDMVQGFATQLDELRREMRGGF